MKILVNGASFSRGPISWPYCLPGISDKTGKNIINLACAGAGNSYIHDTTIRLLDKMKVDLVLIMWTAPQRIDFQISNLDIIETVNSSKYQSSLNDWPEKIIDSLNDQDLIEKNWVFGHSMLMNPDNDDLKKIFNGIYMQMGDVELLNQFLIKVITLQNTLKQLNIPYVFSFDQDYIDQIRMSNLIDWDNCISDQTISDIASNLNDYQEDGYHPGEIANQEWAKIVVDHIMKNKLL